MKAAAIVENAVDIDLCAEQIIVARADLLRAERSIERIRGQLDDAVGTAKMRRIEIGRILSKARPTWPQRGPNAKGWTTFLERVKIDDSTAHRYMEEFRDPVAFSQKTRGKPGDSAAIDPGSEAARDSDPETPANVHGGSGEVARGTYCTPLKYATAVGPWDLDPFSNPRSHIVSTHRCMLEDGGDGLLDPEEPGSWRSGSPGEYGAPIHSVADANTRVWLQPPYELVDEAIAHYGHTRFCALLRFAPDTDWFAAMWPRVQVIATPFGERLPFEIDGVEADGAPFPHAFYYADERDVTDEIRRLCIVLRRAEAQSNPAALHIVR